MKVLVSTTCVQHQPTKKCLITTKNTLHCLGRDFGRYGNYRNLSGLGNIYNYGRGIPDIKSISGGYRHACVIQADDSLLCWGNNDNGQSSVPSGLGSVKSVFASGFLTCAIKADDSVECWGVNDGGWSDYGQSIVPSGLGVVKRIAAGHEHTCAIKADDSVQCWGSDNHGQSTVPADLQ